MNILITAGIFPPDIGGPATYVPQIACALTERGHRILVVTLSDCLDYDDSLYSFRVIRLPRLIFKPWRWFLTVLTIIKFAKDMDSLFINGLAMEAVIANFISRKPVVLKIVGDIAWERAIGYGWVKDEFEYFQEKKYSFKVEALKALRLWWSRKADKIIVPSRYLARRVRDWGVPEENIVVIYNAVELPNGIVPAEVPLKTPIKIVTVGRLVSWKRMDEVIETIARLSGAGLVIVGEGPERENLQALAEGLGISNRLYFAGTKSKREAMALMAACDIFVLNSTYEGLPHVVLEAIELGLPVVATAVGGTPEVVLDGENGLLIDRFDEAGLGKALKQLILSPSERRRLARGAHRSIDQFSLKEMIEKTEALLEAVIDETTIMNVVGKDT
jgi:glycosyltransferase involved in cell wall biosynthesis